MSVIRVPVSTSVVRSEGAEIETVRVVTGGSVTVNALAGTGLPGRDGSASIQRVTAAALGGHRVIAQGDTQLEYADSAVLSHQERVLGLTLGAAGAGTLVTLQRSGEVVEPTWHWALGPVFLGHNGLLTQTTPTPPDAAFLLVVGFATAPDTLYVAPREPVTLKD